VFAHLAKRIERRKNTVNAQSKLPARDLDNFVKAMLLHCIKYCLHTSYRMQQNITVIRTLHVKLAVAIFTKFFGV